MVVSSNHLLNMKKIWTIFMIIIYYARSSLSESEELLNYYMEIITDEITKSESYVFPTYYEGFDVEDDQRKPEEYGTYDFIILGGGTAGSLLANRLSEEEKLSILLIEAGGHENDFSNIPGMYDYLRTSSLNWGSNTTTQSKTCRTYGDYNQANDYTTGTCSYQRGKGLGGSTLINGMHFARGIASDFKKWTDAGLNEWSFDQLLPYMKKFENATSLEDIYPEYHGFEGEMKMDNYKNFSELAFAYMEALEEHGYNKRDYNGPNPFGFSKIQLAIYEGRRQTSAASFLNKTVTSRKNLYILTNSLVTKLNTNSSCVQGVDFIYNHTKYYVNVKKEVILSAGAIGSAQLLMLSGIGPKEDLQKLNITVVKDLPVGLNFKDQFEVKLTFDTNRTTEGTLKNELSQFLLGFGGLTSSAKGDQIVVNQKLGNFSSTQFIIYNGFDYQLINNKAEIKPSTSTSSMVALHHPKSVGTIKLKTRNPLDFPLIDPNFLAEKEDLDAIIEALNNTLTVLEAESLKKFNVTPIKFTAECGNFTYRSYEYLECATKYDGIPGLHGIASCNMGVHPENSVVNDKLLVHGMENLRVVDASVIPFTLTGHLFGTVLTIAEKAADIIKKL